MDMQLVGSQPLFMYTAGQPTVIGKGAIIKTNFKLLMV